MFQNDDKGRNSEGPDVLSEAAMINAYYICHNVQVGSIWLKQDHPPTVGLILEVHTGYLSIWEHHHTIEHQKVPKFVTK